MAAKKSKKPIDQVNFGMAARRTETRELRGALAMQVRISVVDLMFRRLSMRQHKSSSCVRILYANVSHFQFLFISIIHRCVGALH